MKAERLKHLKKYILLSIKFPTNFVLIYRIFKQMMPLFKRLMNYIMDSNESFPNHHGL
ncbi:hypothetical protein B0I26_12718 [Anoxybacillus vitaminiphilus]|uniref:Uncharacterized protein n=1 Tax=Paranoxybacillus vitaminiphilus TaxID=581036 RepID=A0A327Y3J4_9BACL|nr:hypothetical protein [Anoxybacillus vitaminiphilus]RAK14951.1 hypothetical protein B0I26_12718 [Anoxybacillus vitaminiphilus]